MRRQSKGYEIDMCNGTLANKILLFALPLMEMCIRDSPHT